LPKKGLKASSEAEFFVEFAGFEHFRNDVAASDKLPVDVNLR
jgi:hypothetical protein